MEVQETYCKNCNALVQKKYCSQCGQKGSVNKVTFSETINDLVSSLFMEDGPLLKTLKLLIVNPGKLFKEYLAGKRKTYYRPVTFFVLISVVYLLIRALIDYDPFQNTTISVDDETPRQLLLAARDFMLQNIDKFLFVFVFSLGLMMKLFFYKNYSLVEYIAISFYLVGVYMMFGTVNMFYIQYVSSDFQFLAMLAMLLYFSYAMLTFIYGNKIWTVFKSIIALIIGIMFYGFSAFGISFLIVWLKTF